MIVVDVVGEADADIGKAEVHGTWSEDTYLRVMDRTKPAMYWTRGPRVAAPSRDQIALGAGPEVPEDLMSETPSIVASPQARQAASLEG